jgi:hypothetical protein
MWGKVLIELIKILFTQIVSYVAKNSRVHKYVATRCILILQDIAEKTPNTFDDKIVFEITILLKRLEIIDDKLVEIIRVKNESLQNVQTD